MKNALLRDFESYLRNVRNCSELTIKAYCTETAQFLSIMEEKYSFGEITRQAIETLYVGGLVGAGESATTRARKISSVKAFYRWAIDNGYLEDNPAEKIQLPKLPHKEPKVMNRKEVADTMLAAKNDSDAKENLFRDMAIIQLMFTTGVRRAEVVEIKLEDVNLKESCILIHGKGNKERFVYFNDSTQFILSEYIYSHRNLLKHAKESQYLFVSNKSDKLNVSTINRIVNANLEKAGVKEKGYTAHSTRKAFATEVYNNTRDIYVVQKLLGHQNATTTARYVGVSNDIKKQAAMAVSF